MSDRQSIVSDPDVIRARAMETLFERLENLCEGAIAIDRAGRVVYVNEKYLPSLGLHHASEAIGRAIEEIIPNSLMRRVAETGEPILLDIMELGGEQLIVTRMPIEDENKNVIGAIGFVLYDRLDSLKPLIARMGQLESDLRVARRQLSRTARFTFDDYVGHSAGIARATRRRISSPQAASLMVVIGGMGTIYGAIIGAAIFILAQNYLQALMGAASNAAAEAGLPLLPGLLHPDRWLLWLGLLFIASVYFFPTGVVGRLRNPARRPL